MDKRSYVKNLDQSHSLMGVEIVSIEIEEKENHTCFLKVFQDNKMAYCLIKNIYQNHDCIKPDLIVSSCKDVNLSNDQKLVMTTIYLAYERLGNIELSILNKLNNLCFRLYIESNKSYRFLDIVESICDVLQSDMSDYNLPKEMDNLCNSSIDELFRILETHQREVEEEKESIARDRAPKLKVWEDAMSSNTNLNKEQLRVLIINSDDMVDFFGIDVFYETVSHLELKDLTRVVTVRNDTDEFKKYIAEGYPILKPDASISKCETIEVNSTELEEFTYVRDRSYNATRFRVLTSSYKQEKLHLMRECTRNVMSTLGCLPNSYLGVQERKSEDGEYAAFFFNCDTFEPNDYCVYVPLSAIRDNSFEAIIKYHTDYHTKRFEGREKNMAGGTLQEVLAGLNGPLLTKLRHALEKRASKCLKQSQEEGAQSE